MRQRFSDLWNGRVPLARVFWNYAVLYGSLANLLATGAALTAFLWGWPILGLVFHFLLMPYNVLMVVAVWRSAARYEGDAIWAQLARGAILVWAAIATLA
jgi:hypothetical protein